MNQCGDENPFCYFHPREKLVGVCAFCLKERLVVLASKQRHLPIAKDTRKGGYNVLQRKSSLAIPKIFAFGSFLLRPSQNKSVDFDQEDTSTSQEDSFISMKFEDNGKASWDKDGTYSKVPIIEPSSNHKSKKVALNPLYIPNNNKENKSNKSVIEHVKPHATSLWWRKRVGQLFQMVQWKRSSKAASVCHVGTKVGGVKVRKGWIRSLSKKKRTME